MLIKETTTSILTRTDESLFIVRVKAGAYETLELAQENGKILLELKGEDPPLPILIDFSQGAGQHIDARKYYAEHSGAWCSKAAFLTNSPITRVIGNIYMGLNKPKVPTQLFNTEEAARDWLLKH